MNGENGNKTNTSIIIMFVHHVDENPPLRLVIVQPRTKLRNESIREY